MVRLPFCPSPVALLALFRLWLSGDTAFHGEALTVKGTTWTTRLLAGAVLHDLKPPTGETRPAPGQRRPDRHLQGTLPAP